MRVPPKKSENNRKRKNIKNTILIAERRQPLRIMVAGGNSPYLSDDSPMWRSLSGSSYRSYLSSGGGGTITRSLFRAPHRPVSQGPVRTGGARSGALSTRTRREGEAGDSGGKRVGDLGAEGSPKRAPQCRTFWSVKPTSRLMVRAEIFGRGLVTGVALSFMLLRGTAARTAKNDTFHVSPSGLGFGNSSADVSQG